MNKKFGYNDLVRKILICLCFLYSINTFAKNIYYRIENRDQMGMFFLSLGHPQLWSVDGKINQFKKTSNFKYPDAIKPDQLIRISDSDINFKNNVIVSGQYFKFKKKIRTYNEYLDLLENEKKINPEYKSVSMQNTVLPIKLISAAANGIQSPILLPTETLQITNDISQHSFDIYLGAGGFIASDIENDRDVSTTTMTGLQPLVQLKAIYSNTIFGSIAMDLLTKKIINNKFVFPVNIDYRIQYLPKWNISDSCKLALSHSVLQHSYVGKNSNDEIAYELKTNFLGIGLVFPQNDFWFEFYVEKAYQGETKSNERTQQANSGIRIDTELVYPIYKNWKTLPGLNYYQLADSSVDYNFSVFEARLTVAHEFEF